MESMMVQSNVRKKQQTQDATSKSCNYTLPLQLRQRSSDPRVATNVRTVLIQKVNFQHLMPVQASWSGDV